MAVTDVVDEMLRCTRMYEPAAPTLEMLMADVRRLRPPPPPPPQLFGTFLKYVLTDLLSQQDEDVDEGAADALARSHGFERFFHNFVDYNQRQRKEQTHTTKQKWRTRALAQLQAMQADADAARVVAQGDEKRAVAKLVRTALHWRNKQRELQMARRMQGLYDDAR